MPDQITSLQARLDEAKAEKVEHEDCSNPPKGFWHDYGTHVMCTRCGEPKPEESQPIPAPAKKAVASRRPAKEKA